MSVNKAIKFEVSLIETDHGYNVQIEGDINVSAGTFQSLPESAEMIRNSILQYNQQKECKVYK